MKNYAKKKKKKNLYKCFSDKYWIIKNNKY
jgi:hypothetical protein